MSDVIRLLPDSVANQIAAGEVIQRPSSVVKELVENAIDAGATTISIAITNAGKTSIQVIDNGKGMSMTDARMAFERHATSKIRQASDLFALHTLGFRGEALASIAAVAQVVLKTKREQDEIGTIITIEGSKVTAQEPESCPAGANFTVNNLFYNVPARRKFLKSDNTELSNIMQELERIMLVNPQVAFTLRHNGNNIFAYQPAMLKKRITDIFGRKTGQQLLNMSVKTHLATISGYIGTPESSRKKAHQFFFVNNRYMRHPYFAKAVMEAYDKIIPPGEQVPFFIYMTVDPANIDVNIHPTKTEIKFENEHQIWQILLSAARQAIARSSAVPAIDFDTEGMPDIPPMPRHGKATPPKVNIDNSYNPFKQTNWRELYDGLRANNNFDDNSWAADLQQTASNSQTPLPLQGANMVIESKSNETLFDDEKNNPQHYYQYKGKYIITSISSGMLIIDQHRAHINILYDKFRKTIDAKNGNAQCLLFPEMLNLPPSEDAVMPDITGDLNALGFELSSLGNGAYSINAVPAELRGADYVKVITGMIHTASEKAKDTKDSIRSAMALELAKASAIPYGQALSSAEMDSIVAQLLMLPQQETTPDGKKTMAAIKDNELDKML